jgi:hypothetical protein
MSAFAWGVFEMHQQPSAVRIFVASIMALVAPLFWPGAAEHPASTAGRVLAWSAACAIVGAVLILVIGGARQSPGAVVAAAAMLMLLLLVAHALAATIEVCLRACSVDASSARPMAGTLATLVVALLGSLPMWLGPAAELFARAHAWAIDAVVAASPLTHLALASGNDLLRNEWLYDRSNLAKLAVTYPGVPAVVAGYVATLLALHGIPLARRNFRRYIFGAYPPCSTTEEVR